MAGFTALGLGLMLGGLAGGMAAKKLAPKPGAAADQKIGVMEKAAGMVEPPKPVDGQAAASANTATAQGQAVRTRKRVAAGAQTPAARTRARLGGAPAAGANLSSASLIGY